MKDLTEARKLLGVDEKATKDDIIKRYDVILKKYKDTDEIDGVKLEDLYNAYNLLMGYDLSDKPEMQPEKPSFFSTLSAKIFKLDARKVDNFFHYNKWKILAGIIGLIVVISTIKTIVTNVPADLYLTSVGEISIKEPEKVEANIKTLIPTLKAPQVEAMYIKSAVNQDQTATPQPQQGQQSQQVNQQLQQGQDGEQNYAMQMKVTVMLAAGDLDVLLVDKANYEYYAKQGTFINVGDISKDLGIDIKKDDALKIDTTEGESGVYGVDVTNSQFLKDNGIIGKQIIATVRVKAKHEEDALKLYKKIYETIGK